MVIFGWRIERVRGTRIGNLQDAIENAQQRLALLENVAAIQRRKDTKALTEQEEIQKVLAGGDGTAEEDPDDLLWEE
ncbi:hypothetical protein ES703_117831 [subsurface metagenome]